MVTATRRGVQWYGITISLYEAYIGVVEATRQNTVAVGTRNVSTSKCGYSECFQLDLYPKTNSTNHNSDPMG